MALSNFKNTANNSGEFGSKALTVFRFTSFQHCITMSITWQRIFTKLFWLFLYFSFPVSGIRVESNLKFQVISCWQIERDSTECIMYSQLSA